MKLVEGIEKEHAWNQIFDKSLLLIKCKNKDKHAFWKMKRRFNILKLSRQ